jgi:hypothetical protein
MAQMVELEALSSNSIQPTFIYIYMKNPEMGFSRLFASVFSPF